MKAFELTADVLAEMFRLAPNMLAIASFDGRFLAVNAAWEATLGWEESQLLGEPFLALVHPDDVEDTVAESTAMGERGSGKFTNRYRCRDGRYRWLEWVSEPRPAEGLIYAIARDITDRVDAETAVRVAESRYRLILESLPDAVVLLADADLRCTYLGGAALTKAGIRTEDHTGQDLHDIYAAYGDGRQALLDAHLAAAAGRSSSFDLTSAISGEDYHLTVVPLLEDSGPGASMLVASNVSDRHRREDELAVASEQLRQIIEHSPIGMAIVGLDGRFISVNAALCRIVGYAEEDLTELTFQDITHPDDLDLDLAYVKQLLDGEIPACRMDKRYFHADGSVVWIQLSASIVRDAQGVPVHFIAQIEDISQRKLREIDLTHRAQRDGLTGLLNRAEFDLRPREVLQGWPDRRPQHPAARRPRSLQGGQRRRRPRRRRRPAPQRRHRHRRASPFFGPLLSPRRRRVRRHHARLLERSLGHPRLCTSAGHRGSIDPARWTHLEGESERRCRHPRRTPGLEVYAAADKAMYAEKRTVHTRR